LRAPAHGLNGGVADRGLDEAMAAFRAACDRRPLIDGAPGREPVSVRFLEKKRVKV
jgi:hypothetical protein